MASKSPTVHGQLEHDVEEGAMKKSEIQKFFEGQTIFVTGGTGFLGKLLIEKLMWDCNDLKKIYILCLKPLREKFPNFLEKVSLIKGDCAEPDVGLSSESKRIITAEVTTIFHVAATVRFDQHLKTAANINVRSVRDILRIAKTMPQLKAFLHVSTAYSHCPRKEIMEEFYSSPISSENLLNLVNSLDEETITKITPLLLKDWPNTYVFTKAVAESVIQDEGEVRPAVDFEKKFIIVDMDFSVNHDSSIIRFYEGKTIFITGATGFLGHMIIEKLLRTCKGLKKIYILVRPKKGKETRLRMEELFEGPGMELMKEQNPNYKEQVILMNGDLLQPMCGLSEDSVQILKKDVEIIIHCAATVRFDQVIRNATYINVRAVKDLMEIAREIEKLKVFMYISTAFSFCPRKEIDEAFYPPPIGPKELIRLVELLDDEKLNSITPTLIGKWPNTYTFTKAVSEGLIAEEGWDLPMVVVRPSIVVPAIEEPRPGWVNNIYGPSAIVVATGLGFMKCFLAGKNNNADMVPADYVVNLILAVLFERSERRESTKQGSLYNQKIIPIYNYCSTPFAPVTWGEYMCMVLESGITKGAVSQAVYYPTIGLRKCIYHHNIAFFFLQTIPAYLAAAIMYLMGKDPIVIPMLGKLKQITNVLCYFALREWEFGTANTIQLWKDLGPTDRKLFNFDMNKFDWRAYFDIYISGIRLYLLKEPLDSLPAGVKKFKMLYVVHILIKTFFYLLFLGILYYICRLLI